ncbi:MAG TPA: phosphoglycerate kinase [Thermoanaerobaculia bacterium]|nr:phosphoglycerate kinase [Thermoanaerobaculia bacterium]
MPDLPTLEDLPDEAVRDRPVLVRVDFNVPMDGDRVVDATRLREALPTLDALRERGARQLLVSHRGRPKGVRRPELSLEPVARALAGLWGREVAFAPDCVGDPARAAADDLPPGGACLLENVRFHPGEEANDPAFAAQLAALASAYVSDAFGTAHRAHASVAGVPALVGHRAAGRLMALELERLGRLLHDPERPYVAILGGAKISGKIELLASLVERVDALLVGGGMANTFLAAGGRDLASSLVETDQLDTARGILASCERTGVRVELPTDLVITDSLDAESPSVETTYGDLPAGTLAVDVGPETRERFRAAVAAARTVFWNGPLGVFERPPFDRGSVALAAALAACPGYTVIGGGETAAAVERAGCTARIGHVSTGGGAALALLAGKPLPGVLALR